MPKRKRRANSDNAGLNSSAVSKVKVNEALNKEAKDSPITIQIVAGSYDRVLHGITAKISAQNEVEFADTFLFNAHASALRCLALSPPSASVPGQPQKII